MLSGTSFASNIIKLVLIQPPFGSDIMKFQMTFIICMYSKRNKINILLFQLKHQKQADDYNSRKSIISKPKAILDGYSKTKKTLSYDKEDTQKRKQALVIGFRICQEVSLNSLEKSTSFLFTSLNLVFLDLVVTFGVILAGALQDGSSIWGCH